MTKERYSTYALYGIEGGDDAVKRSFDNLTLKEYKTLLKQVRMGQAAVDLYWCFAGSEKPVGHLLHLLAGVLHRGKGRNWLYYSKTYWRDEEPTNWIEEEL